MDTTYIPHPLGSREVNLGVHLPPDASNRVWYPKLDECGYQPSQFASAPWATALHRSGVRLDVDAQQVDHLLIVKAFADELDLVETANRLVPTQMGVKPGIIVLGLVLDTLTGRSPVYRLVEFYEGRDTELLLGGVFQPMRSMTTPWVGFWTSFSRQERNGSFQNWL